VRTATREPNLVAEGAHHKADARVAFRDAEVEARILRHKVELLEGELAKEQERVTWLKGQRDQLLQGEKEYVKGLAEQKLRTEVALRDLGHMRQERDYLREERAAAAGKLKVIREEHDSALTRLEGLQKQLKRYRCRRPTTASTPKMSWKSWAWQRGEPSAESRGSFSHQRRPPHHRGLRAVTWRTHTYITSH
jgi:chromosome segregation ATPase